MSCSFYFTAFLDQPYVLFHLVPQLLSSTDNLCGTGYHYNFLFMFACFSYFGLHYYFSVLAFSGNSVIESFHGGLSSSEYKLGC